jgi:hypothetical protein
MHDQAKRFEIMILRPLQIIFIVSAVVCLFKGIWWWMAGCILGLLYLGIVGSKLHPLQSASDLAKGPTEGPVAQNESEILPPIFMQMLLGHACTRVGILLGILAGVVSWSNLGWRWYFAILFALFAMIFSGVLLKLMFKTI